MNEISCDLCVIGAGSAGLSVASGAAQLGLDTVLIEAGEMGGDCLNTGCVPSKSLIAAAHAAEAQRRPAVPGVVPQEPQIDWPAIQTHIRDVIASIAPHDSQERFEGLGVKVIREWATFTGPETVETESHRITARRFVIATGARASVPPVPGLSEARYLTNETIFDIEELPEHLLVLGGGPIGLELAQAFRRLGAQVTVIEAAKALGRDDADAAALVTAQLRAEGVVIHEDKPAKSVSEENGQIQVALENEVISGSHLLVATGRTPNIEKLNLDAAGVEVVHGAVRVTPGLKTRNRRIYAIGDVTGGLQFTHMAGYEAGLVVRNAALRLPVTRREDCIPRVTYTAPELAQIGLTEAEAKAEHGDKIEIIQSPLGDNDRARADGETAGFLKLMVKGGKPVGVTIVGEGAGEMISPWALAMSKGLKLSAISGMVLPYPTRGEVSKAASGSYFAKRLFDNQFLKMCINLIKKL
ncbi:dihydrolipoyl dehydrogenase family protein [Paracoccaceae bacterium GXU_MW_L88]